MAPQDGDRRQRRQIQSQGASLVRRWRRGLGRYAGGRRHRLRSALARGYFVRNGTVVELLAEWRDADVSVAMLRRDRRVTPGRLITLMAFLSAGAADRYAARFLCRSYLRRQQGHGVLENDRLPRRATTTATGSTAITSAFRCRRSASATAPPATPRQAARHGPVDAPSKHPSARSWRQTSPRTCQPESADGATTSSSIHY